MQAIATYSDGSERDVTKLSIFTANTEAVASVNETGRVQTLQLGETAVSARFERTFATAEFIVLRANPAFQPTPVPDDNLIDRHVVAKLNALNIEPSPLAADEMFLRRVYLDLIGVQPTPEELSAFVKDAAADKRERVIDALFARPEFVDQWSLKWGDLLQNSRNQLTEPAVYAFREWIRAAVASNMPLDQFVREVLLSQGGPGRQSHGGLLRSQPGYACHDAACYAGVLRRADALCPVPFPSVRELDPRRLLRSLQLLQPGVGQDRCAAARRHQCQVGGG